MIHYYSHLIDIVIQLDGRFSIKSMCLKYKSRIEIRLTFAAQYSHLEF